jgi:hypothetical protein
VDSFSGGFGANKFQGAFNKTVLPECLVNKHSTSIASPMKDLKIKGGSFDMAGAAGVAGVAIGMLGSAIGKGDGDAATFTKREERRFDEQYFKGVGTGLL